MIIFIKTITEPEAEPKTSGPLFTPLAPGTRVLASNVIQTTTSKVQLSPGVYKIKNPEGTETVLVVKDDKGPITILPKESSLSILLYKEGKGISPTNYLGIENGNR